MFAAYSEGFGWNESESVVSCQYHHAGEFFGFFHCNDPLATMLLVVASCVFVLGAVLVAHWLVYK
jgi:hypothetical protein